MLKGRILWIENDPGFVQSYVNYLRNSSYVVELATTPEKVLRLLNEQAFDVALIDLVLPHGDELDPAETYGGYRTGIALGSRIRTAAPATKIIGVSFHYSDEVEEWFTEFGHGFWLKSDLRGPRDVLNRLNILLGHERPARRAFIVHGHDDVAKLALKNFLQNSLGFAEPVILHEKPSAGRTLIEKLEEESLESDYVFAILTPDDPNGTSSSSNAEKRRARQNVIFELGYFYGRMSRRSGRVFLLHGGDLELPSDISGIVYLDISAGIPNVAEQIRKEVERTK